jgi:hypothetical protein
VGFVVKQVYLKILGLFHASWQSSITLYSSITTYELCIVVAFQLTDFAFCMLSLQVLVTVTVQCCHPKCEYVSHNEPQLVLQNSQ